MLVDLPFNGETRKALVTAGKLAIVEALDRTNGQFLWAKETVPPEIVKSIDPKTGEKTLNPEAIPHIGKTTVNCPADPGARGWPATAYSPRTQMLYLPLTEFAPTQRRRRSSPGKKYTGGGRAVYARVRSPTATAISGVSTHQADGPDPGLVDARSACPMTSAVLPTAGGLVFAGSLDRWFRAYDDTTGKVLWQMRTNNAVECVSDHYQCRRQAIYRRGGRATARRNCARSRRCTPTSKNPDGGSVAVGVRLPD